MSTLQARGAVSRALDDLSENPLIAFLRSWSNGRIPRACFSWATASKSSASASTTGSQDGDRRIISQTHEASQPLGRGTWPWPQGTTLTVGRGEAPLPTHQPRSGWTCYIQERTEKCICTRAHWAPTHQCHPPCVLSVPSSPSVQHKEMAAHWELSHSCARDQLLCLGIWDTLSMPPREKLQAGTMRHRLRGRPVSTQM